MQQPREPLPERGPSTCRVQRRGLCEGRRLACPSARGWGDVGSGAGWSPTGSMRRVAARGRWPGCVPGLCARETVGGRGPSARSTCGRGPSLPRGSRGPAVKRCFGDSGGRQGVPGRPAGAGGTVNGAGRGAGRSAAAWAGGGGGGRRTGSPAPQGITPGPPFPRRPLLSVSGSAHFPVP